MISDIELDISRSIFELETQILIMDLKQMIEKTITIEKILRTNNNKSHIHKEEDVYKPGNDVVCPPKKRMKL